jgi:hypothetical protein
LFEVLILRPLNIGFLILAVISLLKAAWIVGIAMAICWFFIGLTGQALPHRRPETFSELVSGSTPPSHDALSHEESFGLAKATIRAGAVVGFAAFVLGWKSGMRWYWLLLCVLASYAVTFAIGATVPILIGRRSRMGRV